MEISRRKKVIVLGFIRLIADRITFHSTSDAETRNTMMYFGRNAQVVQIPNFLELPPVETRNASNPRYLLFVGRIHPIKGLDNLIEALSKSTAFLQSEVRLHLAGNDQNIFAAQLKQKISELGLSHKVEFLGQVEGAMKQKFLADAYFLVLPSHTENFGNVVVEALAQGTPVIASNGTPWALLHSRQCGFFVENSPESLSKAIEFVIGMQQSTYLAYRESALCTVREKFDIAKNIESWIRVYQFGR